MVYIYPRGGPSLEIIPSDYATRREMLETCHLEELGDQLEEIARRLEYHGEVDIPKCEEMLSLAWELKQINRLATPTEGL